MAIGDAWRRRARTDIKTAFGGQTRFRVVVAVLALVLALLGPVAAGTPAGADDCAGDGPAPYLHTCGTRVVDANGAPVTLRAVNWYGFDSNDFVAGGLRYQSYQAIVDRIKGLGFNALRIPFSNELVERDPVVSALGPVCAHLSCLPNSGADALGPNSGLYGLDALTILKTIVDYAGGQGLYVILDNHRSQAGWGPQENGLWYTNTTCPEKAEPYTCYSAQSWLDDWKRLGAVFAGDPYVTGMDPRNEPHSVHQPSTCADYLSLNGQNNGAHWGPCGGAANNDTDWQQAASAAGSALLSINPHWLIAVEGVSTFPLGNGGFPDDGWGENLQGAAVYPIALNAPGGGDHLVYSPHDYRFSDSNTNVPPDAMRAAWLRDFGYLVAEPTHGYSAPLWVGEFGTCTHANNCLADSALGSSGTWFSAFTQYLNSGDPANGVPGGQGWSYWPVNGTYSDSWSYSGTNWKTCYGQRENYGVLGGDWSTLAAPLMRTLLFPPSPTPPPPAADTALPNTATSTPNVAATIQATDTPTALASPITATATTTATLTPQAASATPAFTLPISPTATPATVITPTSTVTTATVTVSASMTPGTTTVPPTVLQVATTVTPTTAASSSTPPATTPTTAGATVTPTTVTSATSAPTATAQPSPTPLPSSTPLPMATPPPPPPSQWASFACAPYSITPTPSATATPALKLTPLAILPQPTATATVRPRPTPARRTATRKTTATRRTQAKTARKAQPAPPLISARGSALRKAVLLDLQLRRDGRGRLGGWLHYTDARRGKRLALHEAAFRSASTSCGRTPSALILVRLRDKTHTYDASLYLGVDKRRAAHLTMRLGRLYALTTVFSGRIAITCLPKPSPHKPAYKAPSRKPAARKTAHSATTSRKPAAPKTPGRRGTPSQPPHRAPSH